MQERFQHLFAVISSRRFLQKQGLGNEVPFFICPYKPEEAVDMARLIKQIVNKLSQSGIRVLEINLYDLSIELLKDRGIWEQVLRIEESTSKDQLKELLQGVLKPGLILANQGETIDDYLQRIPEPTFPADADNVIPMLDGDWFADDISDRFRQFLKITFGEEQYEENLNFLETAIGKDIRKYFLKDFYPDHVKRYKKRPIYWLFSSPKGSFNAVIYMHRYRPDTVSVVLNNYLREYRTKLSSRKSHLEQVSISATASQRDKTKALKEIENLNRCM